MSVNRLVLRLLTERAIVNRTLAQDRVRDSDMADLDEMIRDQPQPVIVIFTDDQPGLYKGKDLFSVDQGHTLLVLQLSIAGSTRQPLTPDQVPANAESEAASEDPAATAYYFPQTSKALEMAIDIMERQVMTALSDPRNPWGQLWLSFVIKLGKRASLRGASQQQGTRFAARQINIEVETASDPTPGGPLSARWKAIVDAIAADPDPDFAGLAPLITAALEGSPLTPLQRAMAALGLTADGVRAMGLGDAGTVAATIEVEDSSGDVVSSDAPGAK